MILSHLKLLNRYKILLVLHNNNIPYDTFKVVMYGNMPPMEFLQSEEEI